MEKQLKAPEKLRKYTFLEEHNYIRKKFKEQEKILIKKDYKKRRLKTKKDLKTQKRWLKRYKCHV